MLKKNAPKRARYSGLQQYWDSFTGFVERLFDNYGEDEGLSHITVILVLITIIALTYTNVSQQHQLDALRSENRALQSDLAEQPSPSSETSTPNAPQDVHSASLIVGQDETVDTPLGKLRLSAKMLKPKTEYDAHVAVTAKFLDKGGYTWNIPTDGTWETHTDGWQLQIAPEGYSVGYEWNYDKDGNYTTLKHSYQYYTLVWRPDPGFDSFDIYDQQAIDKGSQIATQ